MNKKLILTLVGLLCLGSLSYANGSTSTTQGTTKLIKIESEYKGETSNKRKWVEVEGKTSSSLNGAVTGKEGPSLEISNIKSKPPMSIEGIDGYKQGLIDKLKSELKMIQGSNGILDYTNPLTEEHKRKEKLLEYTDYLISMVTELATPLKLTSEEVQEKIKEIQEIRGFIENIEGFSKLNEEDKKEEETKLGLEPSELQPPIVDTKSIPKITSNKLSKDEILKEGSLRFSWLLAQLRGIDQIPVDASSENQYNLVDKEKSARKDDFVALQKSVENLDSGEKTQDLKDYGAFAYEMKDTLSKLEQLNEAKKELCEKGKVTDDIKHKISNVEDQVKELEAFEAKSTDNIKPIIKEIVEAFRKTENDILNNKAGDVPNVKTNPGGTEKTGTAVL